MPNQKLVSVSVRLVLAQRKTLVLECLRQHSPFESAAVSPQPISRLKCLPRASFVLLQASVFDSVPYFSRPDR